MAMTSSEVKSHWIPWAIALAIVERVGLACSVALLAVDAILGYAIAGHEILRRAPHAIVSGTLARDEA